MSLTVVFQPPVGLVPAVDIVAIHGLNFLGSPRPGTSTWEQDGKLWIRDFLPEHLSTPCRVLLYEYNSSPALGAAAFTLDDHAKKLLLLLNLKRKKDVAQRPLVFICHSLGGLLVKEALVEATLDTSYQEVLKATKLLVFFGTPHQGGNLATVGDYAAKLYRSIARNPRNDMVESLRATSEIATKRYEQFRHQLENFRVISCYEGLPFSKVTGLIVDKRSATLNLPGSREKQIAINANHSTMCKFASAEQADCELVMGVIEEQLEIAMVQFTDMHQQELLGRLEFPNRGAREAQIWDLSCNADTFAWIWSSPFARWLSGHEKIFWIRGKPASGKSTLVNHISHSIRTDEQLAVLFGNSKVIIITFYFDFRQGTTTANSLKGMLLSIAHALARQVSGLASSLHSRFPDWQKVYANDTWNTAALSEIIRYSSIQAKLPVCLFIDGLDEFSGSSKDQLDLAVCLEQLASPDQVKLCFASRPHDILNQRFSSCKRLDMQDWNQPGLRNYFFSTFHHMQMDNGLEQASQMAHLSQLLAEMAEGVFIWAKFAAEDVAELWAKKSLTFASLLIRVAGLPKNVEAFWDERRDQLTAAERHAGSVLLRIVCSAAQPLSMLELLEVFKHQVNNPDSLHLLEAASERVAMVDRLSCGLLKVKVEKSYDGLQWTKVLLVHKSVRAYLDERGWWLASNDELSPERLWFDECVKFITEGTWALQRALCYRNEPHNTSNPVCKSHGCYTAYPNGCFPSSLLNELYSFRPLTGAFTLLSVSYYKASSQPVLPDRKKKFLKWDTKNQSLVSYAMHYMVYHAWLLQRRRNVACLGDTNLFMCPELIILMRRSRRASCSFCDSTSVVEDGSLNFHGSNSTLNGLADDPSGTLFQAKEHFYTERAFTNLSVSISHHPWVDDGASGPLSSTLGEGYASTDAVKLMRFERQPLRNRMNEMNAGSKSNFVSMNAMRDLKIAVIGSRGSGKSSLVVRYVDGHYVESYYPTIENTFSKIIRYNGQDFATEIIESFVADEYSILNSRHFIGIHGYMLVYSVDSKQGLEMCRILRDKILNHLGVEDEKDVPMMIVGNNSELRPRERQVTFEEGVRVAQELGCGFVEASPRYGENVEQAFEGLIARIAKVQDTGRDKSRSKCSLM